MSYCTVEQVKDLLPKNIKDPIDDPTDPNPTLTEDEIEAYIEKSDDMIDALVGVLYVTPIRKIVTVDRDTDAETEDYPNPISVVCQLLTSCMIFAKLFASDTAPNDVAKYSQDYKKQALTLLNDIRSGASVLKGQRQLGQRYRRPESGNTNLLPVPLKDLDFSKV